MNGLSLQRSEFCCAKIIEFSLWHTVLLNFNSRSSEMDHLKTEDMCFQTMHLRASGPFMVLRGVGLKMEQNASKMRHKPLRGYARSCHPAVAIQPLTFEDVAPSPHRIGASDGDPLS